ncbi:MAG: CotH kinase family protein [Ardenticatenaceae bacterium]
MVIRKKFNYTLFFIWGLIAISWLTYPLWAHAQGSQVVISEFMASNESTLADEEGEFSDWIEIHNRDSTQINLEGWYLTDDEEELTKWAFPETILGADRYLLVFASEKDRTASPLHTNFKLKRSGEYLALVEPDGSTIAWEYAPEYAPQFQDVSYGLDGQQNERYFTSPTPGEPNGLGAADLGPIISDPTHMPALPSDDDNITVTVTVSESLKPVSQVTLHYRVMFGEIVDLSMFDDGMHGDGAADDGVYGAIIPKGASRARDMVRYYITAEDTDGSSRWPLFQEPTNSPEYLGTMISDPDVASALPVLYWFVADPAAAETRAGTRGSLFYDGLFYDNVFVRLRGAISTNWPKKSFKFDFNSGHHFHFSRHENPVEEFNLNSSYGDSAYVREPLAWETYRDAGVPYSMSFPMRVQQNGAFYSVAIFVEQVDERYLERQALDPEGALYKMKNNAYSATRGVEKKTRLDEDHSDLQALIDGIHLPETERTSYLFDHVDLPAVLNYLAASVVMQEVDHISHNYYLYRDTNGTGEWTFLPWDKNLTFRWDNHVHLGHPLYGDHDHPCAWCSRGGNDFIDVLYDTPVIREMYLRRLRTVMDQFLQNPDTSPSDLHYESRINELATQIQPDVALDAAAWGARRLFRDALDILSASYLPQRRLHLYDFHGPSNGGIIPASQADRPQINFGVVEFQPASGNRDEEYVTLLNPNSVAVDISGWRIANDIDYTFESGVVIPAGGTLYLSPDVAAFRQRATSPTGGEGHFVQGNYERHLPNASNLLTLYNPQGLLIDQITFNVISPLAGQLLITELNYHPSPSPPLTRVSEYPPNTRGGTSGLVGGDEFEFLELKNIGTSTLSLGGFRFIDGISYTFPPTATLAAGEQLVLVRNQTEFATRYPDLPTAGVYEGKLSNSGETITLVDHSGLLITSFKYDDQFPWPQTADGAGYTLLLDHAPASPNQPCSWRASSHLYGTPAIDDLLADSATCDLASTTHRDIQPLIPSPNSSEESQRCRCKNLHFTYLPLLGVGP